MFAAEQCQVMLLRPGEVVILEIELSVSWRVESAQYVEERGFAAAGGSEQHDEFARAQFKIGAAQRMDLDIPRVINLGQTAPDEAARVPVFRCRIDVVHSGPGSIVNPQLLQVEARRQLDVIKVKLLCGHVERIGSIRQLYDDRDRPQAAAKEPAALKRVAA